MDRASARGDVACCGGVANRDSWANRGRGLREQVDCVVSGRALRERWGLPRAGEAGDPGEAEAPSAGSGKSTRKTSCQSAGAWGESKSGIRRGRPTPCVRPGPRRAPPPAPRASPPPDGRTWRGGRSRGWARQAASDSAQRWPRAGPRPRSSDPPGTAAAPCSRLPARISRRGLQGLPASNYRAGAVPTGPSPNHRAGRGTPPAPAQ